MHMAAAGYQNYEGIPFVKRSDQEWAEIETELSSLDRDTNRFVQPTELGGILCRMLKVQCIVAKKNDEVSRRVVQLTWCLLWLTSGLCLIALVQMLS